MRKPRSPALLYSFVLISSGIYAYFWAISLLEDLNELLGSPRFNIAVLTRTVVIAWLVYVLCILNLMSPDRLVFVRSIALAIALGLAALLFWLVLSVHRGIGLLTSEHRPGTGSMIGLTFMFFASLLILQTDMNRLLSRR